MTQYISIIAHFKTVSSKQKYPAVFEAIRKGGFKVKIENYRQLLAEGKKKEAEEAKKNLYAFTPSALFDKERNLADLEKYVPIIVLDLDKVTPEEAVQARDRAANIPYTLGAFISPSGNGTKIFVKTNGIQEVHLQALLLGVVLFIHKEQKDLLLLT